MPNSASGQTPTYPLECRDERRTQTTDLAVDRDPADRAAGALRCQFRAGVLDQQPGSAIRRIRLHRISANHLGGDQVMGTI